MALMAALQVPFGPRDLCIVRQQGKTGLPRHSDQRNYMLTAHIVLKGPAGDVMSVPQGDVTSVAAALPTDTAPQMTLAQMALAASTQVHRKVKYSVKRGLI